MELATIVFIYAAAAFVVAVTAAIVIFIVKEVW